MASSYALQPGQELTKSLYLSESFDVVKLEYWCSVDVTSAEFLWKQFEAPGAFEQYSGNPILKSKWDIQIGYLSAQERVFLRMHNFSDTATTVYFELKGTNYIVEEPQENVYDTVEIILDDLDDTEDSANDSVTSGSTTINLSMDGILGDVESYMKSNASAIGESISDAFTDISSGTHSLISTISGEISSGIKGLNTGIESTMEGVTKSLFGDFTKISDGINAIRESITEKIQGFISSVQSIADLTWGAFLGKISDSISGMSESFWEKFISIFFDRDE